MRFVVAGASGFLGRAWTRRLTEQGHHVTRLVRREAGPHESRWDPYAGTVDDDVVEAADVVVCLSGATLAHFPFNERYRRTFRDSRLLTTRTLAEAVARSSAKPAFLAQNGVAGYGDRSDHVVTESTPTDATTFLGTVTREWEAATTPAREAGARVVVMRTAVVLDRDSGALRTMMVPFRIGVGGPLGPGDQYFPVITLGDWMRAATFLASSGDARGAYNLTAPGPPTNAEFSRALAHKLHRPSFVRVPAFAIRTVLRPLAPELLNSVRLEPDRLLTAGFTFEHASLDVQLDAALAPRSTR